MKIFNKSSYLFIVIPLVCSSMNAQEILAAGLGSQAQQQLTIGQWNRLEVSVINYSQL